MLIENAITDHSDALSETGRANDNYYLGSQKHIFHGYCKPLVTLPGPAPSRPLKDCITDTYWAPERKKKKLFREIQKYSKAQGPV